MKQGSGRSIEEANTPKHLKLKAYKNRE